MTTFDDTTTDRLLLDLLPAPALPCPSWCAKPAGHGWEDIQRHMNVAGDAAAHRIPRRTYVDTERGDRVNLYRWDDSDLTSDEGERIRHAAAVHVEMGASADCTFQQAAELGPAISQGSCRPAGAPGGWRAGPRLRGRGVGMSATTIGPRTQPVVLVDDFPAGAIGVRPDEGAVVLSSRSTESERAALLDGAAHGGAGETRGRTFTRGLSAPPPRPTRNEPPRPPDMASGAVREGAECPSVRPRCGFSQVSARRGCSCCRRTGRSGASGQRGQRGPGVQRGPTGPRRHRRTR